jgi:hypothetical protein
LIRRGNARTPDVVTRKATTTKPKGKPTPKAKGKPGPTGSKKGKATAGTPKGYASVPWERIHLLSVELDAFVHDLGMHAKERGPEGFDLVDAARELARLAANHNRDLNRDGRTAEQEQEDWVAVGGLGADLGNMADEGTIGKVGDGVRQIAHELCFLACDYLF